MAANEISGSWTAASLSDAAMTNEFAGGAYLFAMAQNLDAGRGVGDLFAVSAIDTQGNDPDLSVLAVTAPGTGKSGDSIPVQWTVVNDSQYDTPVATWSDAVYLSANDTMGDADDVLVKTIVHSGALAAGQSYSASTTATLPLIDRKSVV